MNRTTAHFVGFLLVLATVTGVVFAAASTTPVTQNSDGYVVNEPAGPTVNLTGNFDKYPTTGGSGNSVYIDTTDGNITLTASGSASARVRAEHLSGLWFNASSVEAAGANLTLSRSDGTSVLVGSGLDTISLRTDAAVDDTDVDFVYGGNSGTSIVGLHTGTPDTTLSAVDADTGQVLGVATSNATGWVAFELPHHSNASKK
jgi:hypothetical protein